MFKHWKQIRSAAVPTLAFAACRTQASSLVERPGIIDEPGPSGPGSVAHNGPDHGASTG